MLENCHVIILYGQLEERGIFEIPILRTRNARGTYVANS